MEGDASGHGDGDGDGDREDASSGDGDGDGDDASPGDRDASWDGGDGSLGDGDADAAIDAEPAPNRAPELHIDFPVTGVVERAEVRVRGRVSDPDGDALTVSVAGEAAQIDDGVFAAQVVLEGGANELEVEVADGRGGTASASVTVERRGALFGMPLDVAVDAASSTAWVADYFFGVIEVDLATGARRVLDGLGSAQRPALGVTASTDGSRIFATFGAEPGAATPRMGVFERARDATEWTLLAQLDGSPDGQWPLRIDSERNRLIMTGATGEIWAIDLSEGPSRGALTQLSASSGGAWMDYGSANNQLLLAGTSFLYPEGTTTGTQRSAAVARLDVDADETAVVWSSPSGTAFTAVSGVAYGGSDTAFVADWSRGTIHSLSLSNGTLTAFSGEGQLGPALMLPEAMVRVSSTIYVIDSGNGALFAVESDGARRVLTRRSTGSGQGFFGPTGLTFDERGDRFLVMDSDPRVGLLPEGAVPSRACLVQVDRQSANRRVISAEGTGSGAVLPWGTSTALHSSGVAFATTNRMGLLSSANEAGSLLEIDLESGERRVVSGATEGAEIIGTGPPLDTAIQVLLESDIHALVLQRNKIVRVHLPSGNRVIITGPDGSDVQGAGPELANAVGFVIDERASRPVAYVAMRAAIVAVDLVSGDRRVISADSDASAGPKLGNVGGIALDATRERVLVVVPSLFAARDVFMEVSLEDGERRYLSDQDEASAVSRTSEPPNLQVTSGLYFEPESRRLWAIDWSLRSLNVLDADTGETVLFSHFGR